MSTVPYDEKLIIETPENVFLEFELAGLGSRFLAYLVDTVIQTLMVIALVYAGGVIMALLRSASSSTEAGGTIEIALLILGIFLVYEGYFIFFETRWHGQSVGKKLLHLRVVKDGGYPISFLDAVIRNMLRVVDAMPPLAFFPSYGLGSAVLLANRRSKRIGDFVAGTVVIKERPPSGFEHFASVRTHPEYLRAMHIRHLHRLTASEYYVLREFFFRKNMFPFPVRADLAAQLAGHLKRKLEVDAADYASDVRFLDDLMLLVEGRHAET